MENHLPTDSGQVGKETYRPWVGVVLSFIISGSAQFLAGKRRAGIAWYLGLLLLEGVGLFCLASPKVPGLMPGVTLVAVGFGLWVFMLVRSYQPVPKLRRSGWLVLIVLGVALAWISNLGMSQVFDVYVIPTQSMAPTLLGKEKLPDGTDTGGDRVFVVPYAYWFSKPARGDIVVLNTTGISPDVRPNEFYAKRIVGLPGDMLSIRDGRLYNQGQRVFEPAILAQMEFTNAYPAFQQFLKLSTDNFQVPDGCYFVVGDNTANSSDSRNWGALPARNIVARVSKIYWPMKRMGAMR